MERIIRVDQAYLYVPISIGNKEMLITIGCLDETGSEQKLFEFMVPIGTAQGDTYPYDYLARFPVTQFTDKTLYIRGDVPEVFLSAIHLDGVKKEEPLARPRIHFSAERGWINDPNGLVFKDGIYHLYFQYNPFNISWNNMSWGHAISRDLLHWEEVDAVLYPDADGMIFSGSGIQNEKELLGLPKEALLFFYTAAGGITDWSKGKAFCQKIAYSLDDGMHVCILDKGMLPTIKKENRDPKVFWHDASKAYIMCLWLEENEFAIFRSVDLEHYERTDSFTLEKAWECPDLFELEAEDDTSVWVFFTADGFYYFGSFDGYHFLTDGTRHTAYINTLPYAAQTYSGTKGRVISVPWIRSKQEGRLFTGCMGLPRQLGIIRQNGERALTQSLVEEFHQKKRRIEISPNGVSVPLEGAIEFNMERNVAFKELVIWDICGTKVCYDPITGVLSVGEEEYNIGPGVLDFSFVLDDTILEVTANHGIMVGVFEIDRTHMLVKWKLEAFTSCEAFSIL